MHEANAWLRFVVAALATWRITHLLASEDGPWNVIAKARSHMRGFWASLMDCFYCLSLWVAAAVTLALRPSAGDGVLVWLALSGAACLLDRLGRDPVMIQQLESPERRGEEEHVLLRSESREDGGDDSAYQPGQPE